MWTNKFVCFRCDFKKSNDLSTKKGDFALNFLNFSVISAFLSDLFTKNVDKSSCDFIFLFKLYLILNKSELAFCIDFSAFQMFVN